MNQNPTYSAMRIQSNTNGEEILGFGTQVTTRAILG